MISNLHLRQSVELDDNLLYSEPWAWMLPTRHALGALLLEAGHVAEAEQLYRADLGLDNTLSPGLQARLNVAMAPPDVPINASCYCRLEKSCCH